VALEVADTGPGIGAGELDKVFAPFYTTTRGGAGLGLDGMASYGGMVGRRVGPFWVVAEVFAPPARAFLCVAIQW
jgi:K+-sensing histidine kinase KdpD